MEAMKPRDIGLSMSSSAAAVKWRLQHGPDWNFTVLPKYVIFNIDSDGDYRVLFLVFLFFFFTWRFKSYKEMFYEFACVLR